VVSSDFARPGDTILIESGPYINVVESIVRVNEENEMFIVMVNASDVDAMIKRGEVICSLTNLRDVEETVLSESGSMEKTQEMGEVAKITEAEWKPSKHIKPFDDYLTLEQIERHDSYRREC
jgi:hypothetical protein